jgi:hypothetical protein
MKSFAIGVTIGGAVSPALGQAFSRVKQSTAELATNMRNTSAQLKAAQAFNKYKAKPRSSILRHLICRAFQSTGLTSQGMTALLPHGTT